MVVACQPETPHADHHGLAGDHAGHAAGQHAAAARRAHQVVGTDLQGEAVATSDIGASSGSWRPAVSTVS